MVNIFCKWHSGWNHFSVINLLFIMNLLALERVLLLDFSIRFRACIVAGLFNFFFFLSFGVMGDYSLLFFDNSIITMGRKDLNFECFR